MVLEADIVLGRFAAAALPSARAAEDGGNRALISESPDEKRRAD